MNRTFLALSLLAIAASAVVGQKPYKPKVSAASEDGRRQMSGFQIDKAFASMGSAGAGGGARQPQLLVLARG